jgi:predicted transcriptional regulator
MRILKLKSQNRFFTNEALAKSKMADIANQNQCTVYLYRQTYGRQQVNEEFSVRLKSEVIDPEHEKVISKFTPANLR